jgi:hypothetical protein
MSKAYQYIANDDKNLIHWKMWVWRKFKLVYKKALSKPKGLKMGSKNESIIVFKWDATLKIKYSCANIVIMSSKNAIIFLLHCKLYGSQINNNGRVKFVFHRFIWNKHRCHSSTCIL